MLEKAFDEYASKFDLKDVNLLSRYNHSYRVMKLCVKYAKMLNWSDDDIELAKIIGLLHDFGRFKQYEIYKSFNDLETIDHADYSVEELFDDNEIIKFTDRKDDYDIIKFAIKNHNKYTIPNCNDERKLKFARLIRDADKVDIMYVLGDSGELDRKGNNDSINIEITKYIKKNQPVPISILKSNNDHLAMHFAFAFDLNYDISLNDFKKNLKGYYQKIEHNNIFNEIYDVVLEYLKNRMERENAR